MADPIFSLPPENVYERGLPSPVLPTPLAKFLMMKRGEALRPKDYKVTPEGQSPPLDTGWGIRYPGPPQPIRERPSGQLREDFWNFDPIHMRQRATRTRGA